MKKKFLAILSRYLWPIDGGRKESLNHYFQELYVKYGYEIHILCFLEKGQVIKGSDIPYYVKEVAELRDVSAKEKISNIVLKSLNSSRWPFQCSLYYSKENFNEIRKKVDEWKPDIIFTEMIRTCIYYQAFKNSDALLWANIDDLLSIRYLRQLNSQKSSASFMGAYSNKIPSFLVKILNQKFLKSILLKMESLRCDIWERKFYNLYDYSLMTSKLETDFLNKRMNSNKAKTLSVGIDYQYYSEEIEIEKELKGLSYIGNFRVASNIDTLDMIVKNILPNVKHDYIFYIIGFCPDEIIRKYRENKKIVFCGRVDDIREYIRKTSIFLCPIAYGTGIKTKIIEAMAMNMPVITNSVGAEGIGAINGKDFLVEDNYLDIANRVDWLLSNTNEAIEIGKNAGNYVEKHFRWEKVLKVFEEIGG